MPDDDDRFDDEGQTPYWHKPDSFQPIGVMHSGATKQELKEQQLKDGREGNSR